MTRSIGNHCLRWTIAAVAALVGLAAYADIPPPGTYECRGKTAGDGCRLAAAEGVCAEKMCGKLDYSQGVPPKSVSVPCLRCEAKAEPSSTAGVGAKAP